MLHLVLPNILPRQTHSIQRLYGGRSVKCQPHLDLLIVISSEHRLSNMNQPAHGIHLGAVD